MTSLEAPTPIELRTDPPVDLKKLRRVMRDISSKRGPFALFGLFLRDDAPDKWDLVVSAAWIEKNKRAALKMVSEKITAVIEREQLLALSRIVPLPRNDPALLNLYKNLRVKKDGSAEIRDSVFNGVHIKHGYILQLQRPS